MKKLFSAILSFILILTMITPLTVNAASSYEQAVSLSSVALSDWMSAIRGETKITEITAPGTHDSCARKFTGLASYLTFIAQCQNKNITEQLDMGVRFLDIRCEADASSHSVKTVHGSADCWNGNDYYYLDYLFQDVYNWLDAHPSESVFLMIKEDDGNVGAPEFTSAIYEYIHGYGQNKYFYGEDYNYNDYWYLSKTVPALDEVRGKIVLFNRFDRYIQTSGSTASESESGQKIKYDNQESTSLASPNFVTGEDWSSGAKYHVQDMYKLSTSDKLTAVQEMLTLGHYRGEYYLNFTSTTTSSSLPNPQNYANTINPAFLNLTFNKAKPSGYIQMDFITEAAARKIVENNEAVSNFVTGTDGNITYEINRLTGTLTISGSGAMNDYALDSNSGIKGTGTTAPWSDQVKDCLFSGQYNTDIITNIVVNEGVTSIGAYAFYGFDNVKTVTLPSSVTAIGANAIPEGVNTDYYSINAKAGNINREVVNPFAGKDLNGGVTISYSQYCDTDRGWNNSVINFSTGNNADNRYFIIMTNGTVLFNDGNGGAGGWNGCYFDINTSSAVNTTGQGWVDIKLTIYKNGGKHYIDYYINNRLAANYSLNDICASGYPNGVSGSDGIFSFLASSEVHLYYGAAFNIYNMGGTTDCYLDNVKMLDYIETDFGGEKLYENTFTESLVASAVTGTVDNGNYVSHRPADNDGRSGTAYFPYSGTNANTTNYAATGVSPFAGLDTSNGFTVSFWQRINGNYWDNRESITLAQGEIGAMKYFTIGTDGYIRFNNGNGGSDASLSSAGLYFDYTTACSAIQKQQWQYVTVDILDDYHFKYYVNGKLINTIHAAGTSQYQASGGLMGFLASGNTKLYFGSYTPYWGTATLSLDNVTCYSKALSDGEVAALYAQETEKTALLENDIITLPERVSGSSVWLDAYHGRNGVLYIPTCSADGDIKVYVNGTATTDLTSVAADSAVTVEYIGSGEVKQWVIKTADGTVHSSDKTYSFTLNSNTTVDVILNVEAQLDESSLIAAIDYAAQFDGQYYSAESYARLISAVDNATALLGNTTSQLAVDSAAEEILTAIYDLVPYLNFQLSALNGVVSFSSVADSGGAGEYAMLFGTRVTVSAGANEGYIFLGWFEKDTKRFFSQDLQYTFMLTSNTRLEAVFVKNSAATLTFQNSTGYIKASVSKTPEEWLNYDSLSALIPEVPYKYGAGDGRWDYNDDEVLKKLQSGESVAITAVYDNDRDEEKLPALPSASDGIPAVDLYFNYDENENVGSYVMAAAIPEGCKTESMGIAFYYGKPDAFEPAAFRLTMDNRLLTSKFPVLESGINITNVKKFSKYNWSARGYVTYYDENSVLRVAYSEQINVINGKQV